MEKKRGTRSIQPTSSHIWDINLSSHEGAGIVNKPQIPTTIVQIGKTTGRREWLCKSSFTCPEPSSQLLAWRGIACCRSGSESPPGRASPSIRKRREEVLRVSPAHGERWKGHEEGNNWAAGPLGGTSSTTRAQQFTQSRPHTDSRSVALVPL